MKFTKSPDTIAYTVLTLLTVASLGFQYSRRAPEAGASSAPPLAAGTALPSLALRSLDAAAAGAPKDERPAPTGCRLLVMFHTECALCHSSAARESQAAPGAARLPVVWITAFDDKASREFAAQVRAENMVRFDNTAPQKLKIKVVPTAFLISADNRVRDSWTYLGNEDHGKLRERC